MWPIVRDAVADASPAVRRQIQWVVVLWVGILLLQVWDSRNAAGVPGVAEFLSAFLGASGVALLGTAHTLQRTMHESSERQGLDPPGPAAAIERVLLTLPAFGFASGVALGAATVLMILRAFLGADLLLAVVALAAYASMLVFAGRTVIDSTRTLYQHATRHAALAADARSQAASAQLAALQARMNPHFLFNALNTVAAVIHTNPLGAERIVENLSDVLRQTLQRSASAVGTVQEEIDYVRAYLTLEQERWGARLQVVWDVDARVGQLALPPLVLQPLVENALAHGIGSRVEGGTIKIAVRADADRLSIRVDDDGAGFPPKWTARTGLGTLRDRLSALYGEGATLEATSDAGGAHVSVSVPLR